MKKMTMVLGVLACVALLVNPVMACDCDEAKSASNEGSSCDKAAVAQASNDASSCSKTEAVTASNDGSSCSISAAKAAYAKAIDETGCEKTAKTAYNNTVAEHAYTKSYAASSCSKTAEKAAYAAVYSESSCDVTSKTAATHAVAKASYDTTLAKTGCEKTAQAAYASVTKTAGASCDVDEAGSSDCSKSGAETSSDKIADANTKLASNEEGSSR